MAIFKPSQHFPNLQEVDLRDSNEFSCLVNTSGEQIQAYKTIILSEDGEEIIGDGYCDNQGIYHDGAVNLPLPLSNKKTLKIQNISQNFHKAGKTFENGKNYQWGVRLYNAKVGSTDQPNTKVCEGFLVGSTKYVTWSKIPKTEKEVLDQLLPDRYIEYVANSGNDLVIGGHEPKDKVKPTTYPYIQRRKIDWVTKELGIDENFVKIEVDEDFDFDYYDSTEYKIYQCSSEHTVKSLFADPNSSLNVTDMVIVYKTLADAQAAREDGETPDNILDTSRWASCMERTDGSAGFAPRKITGYSIDTGEMRFADVFKTPPQNGQYYRLFEKKISPDSMAPLDDETTEEADPLVSHVVGGIPITSPYFKSVSNKWSNNGPVQRLFIQPNINIKSDSTNPNEIVFSNGVRVNIPDQYWTNNGTKVDITFNKLDNTQWILENQPRNESGQSITAVIPSGTSVPTTPQTDYVVYTDFVDSMPYNVFYARSAPSIKLQFRNALKELKEGYLVNDDFLDGNGISIEKSEFIIYYDLPNDEYYKWMVVEEIEGFVRIPKLLKEGRYDNGEFYDDTTTPSTVLPHSIDWLYYDIPTQRHYIYSEDDESYVETSNAEVIWVDVNSSIPRDYREVEFRALWEDENGNIMKNPQVKNYTYSIYAYPQNFAVAELIKEGKTYYDTTLKWTFRGLDGTPSSYYSILNPHRYRVKLLITDEYDKEYITEADFSIFYQTERAPIPIRVSLLCDEQAYQVEVNAPVYAQSTNYGDRFTVTDNNLDKRKGLVNIPNDHTLNYTQTTNGAPLVFPKSFSTLSKIQLTEDFINKYSVAQGEVELCALNHSLESIKISIGANTPFYRTTAPASTVYYLDSTLQVPAGNLSEARPYTIGGDAYGVLTLSDTEYILYHVKIDSAGILVGSSSLEITNEMSGVTIEQPNDIFSIVTLDSAIGTISAGTYYVLNDYISSTENNEEFVYKVNIRGPFYINPTDQKIYRNVENNYLKLYRKGPGEAGYTQLHNCFFVNGAWQDYILLSDNTTGLPTIFNAIQNRNNGDYIIATSGLPDMDTASEEKKYVLQYDTVQNDTIYFAGVYRVVTYYGGRKEWAPISNEDYIYIDDTNQVGGVEPSYHDLGIDAPSPLIPLIKDGTRVSNTQWKIGSRTYNLLTEHIEDVSTTDNSYYIYHDTSNNNYYYWDGTELKTITNFSNSKGQINFSDDNNVRVDSDYIWLDNNLTQQTFKSYILNKEINLFLTVKYSNTGVRTLKSQVLLENLED